MIKLAVAISATFIEVTSYGVHVNITLLLDLVLETRCCSRLSLLLAIQICRHFPNNTTAQLALLKHREIRLATRQNNGKNSVSLMSLSLCHNESFSADPLLDWWFLTLFCHFAANVLTKQIQRCHKTELWGIHRTLPSYNPVVSSFSCQFVCSKYIPSLKLTFMHKLHT